jgi:hypothetical protein
MTEREKRFVEELAALLDRHGLTIEQHTCYDSTLYRLSAHLVGNISEFPLS